MRLLTSFVRAVAVAAMVGALTLAPATNAQAAPTAATLNPDHLGKRVEYFGTICDVNLGGWPDVGFAVWVFVASGGDIVSLQITFDDPNSSVDPVVNVASADANYPNGIAPETGDDRAWVKTPATFTIVNGTGVIDPDNSNPDHGPQFNVSGTCPPPLPSPSPVVPPDSHPPTVPAPAPGGNNCLTGPHLPTTGTPMTGPLIAASVLLGIGTALLLLLRLYNGEGREHWDSDPEARHRSGSGQGG
jgi:hypothetical protein